MVIFFSTYIVHSYPISTLHRYVLDGFPATKAQVELLVKLKIVPVCLVELEVSNEELLQRAAKDRSSAARHVTTGSPLVLGMYIHHCTHVHTLTFSLPLCRTLPLHDSSTVMLLRAMQYRKHIDAIREWYSKEHDNWHKVDGEQSQWLVWEQAQKLALYSAQQIQQYLTRVINGWMILVVYSAFQCDNHVDRNATYMCFMPFHLISYMQTRQHPLLDCASLPLSSLLT